MANLIKTRHLFAFTSPRTIEKIIPEVELLSKNFEGQKWMPATQSAFYESLFASDFFEGENKARDTELAARDRITRAPKALGFVNLKPVIELTEAGKQLVSGKRIHETITRQLLKFQLPSPYHTDKDNRFFVKQYLEFLRLVKTVGSLSKTETALFFLQLTQIGKFDEIVNKILKYRDERKKWKGNRKVFVKMCFEQEIAEIFKDEIEKKEFDTRESTDNSFDKFVRTKMQNMTDYADAFIRYMRAIQLITFQDKTFRVIISPSKKDEVDFILQNIDRRPILFKTEKDFKNYLFSSTNIQLLNDDITFLVDKLQKLNIVFDSTLSLEALKDLLQQTVENIKIQKIIETSKQLKDYKEFDDIIEVFDKIVKRVVPDAPLYLEWNVWRAMTMINFALSVQGNFTIDTDGVPLNIALGNKPDIEIEYETFKLVIEVTLSSGNTQYIMENESVPRHIGDIQNISQVPVFCFFIAPKISEGTLAHFFDLNKMNTRRYGGKTRIIPVNLNNFVDFIKTAKNSTFSNPKILHTFLDKLVKENQEAEDEVIWFDSIKKSVENWAV